MLRSEMQSSNERSLIDLHEKAFTNLSPFSLTILYVCTSILCVIKQFSQITLTEVAGEGGPDLAPQKFLLSQKFRHLMR